MFSISSKEVVSSVPRKLVFIARQFFKYVLFALVSPVALAMMFLGIRFSSGTLNNRIGHLIGEPLYLETQKRLGRPFFRYFVLLLPETKVANTAVLDAFPDHFIIVRNKIACRFLYVFNRHPITSVNMTPIIIALSSAALIHKHTHLITSSKPFLSIPGRENLELKDLLSVIGVKEGGWYVCLHNRETGYSLFDDDEHQYRNGTLSNFYDAIDFISELGGVVIRMGDPSMTKLDEKSRAFDYAHSALKTPRNDLLLAANCRFFLGNSSGISIIASAQGIPCIGVNQAPLGVTKFWGPNDLAVPKIYRRVHDGSIIPFSEVFSTNLSNYRSASDFKRVGVFLQENSPDEILESCREMEMSLRKTPEPEDVQGLRTRFNSMFTPENYSYFSKTRISRYFLEKYSQYY
jgi:putative glycosyltransferase (TIGR04372 family)